MITRSISRYLEKQREYEVNIDFDEASAAWKANKTPTGNGCYKYICEHKNKIGRKCRKNPISGCNFCSQHI